MTGALVRIRDVEPLTGTSLRLRLTDGRVVVRDVGPLLRGAVFAALREHPERFREVRVVDGTVAWPGGLELCPDTVVWGGLPPADGEATSPPGGTDSSVSEAGR